MPRIAPALVRQVSRQDPLLALLVGVCRSESQAAQELRWLRQELRDPAVVRWACAQRARQVPLQYVLGSQPFGGLELVCRPRVLIPRWETEEWCCELARRLRASGPRPLQVVDLCTGTGCVGLQLQQSMPTAEVTAVDCSPHAVELAALNARRNNLPMRVLQHDVLQWAPRLDGPPPDLVVCNPPYIPRTSFVRETAPAVKLYEPRLALVGDKEFYANLVDTWLKRVNVRAFAYEVGDSDQCEYVVARVRASTELADRWSVGTRRDAAGKPRLVYGFRGQQFAQALDGFGELQHVGVQNTSV